jgi:hypothetical protein
MVEDSKSSDKQFKSSKLKSKGINVELSWKMRNTKPRLIFLPIKLGSLVYATNHEAVISNRAYFMYILLDECKFSCII